MRDLLALSDLLVFKERLALWALRDHLDPRENRDPLDLRERGVLTAPLVPLDPLATQV